MHALIFAFKRAHFVSQKLLNPFTLPHGLTPARFDLLYKLHVSRYRKPFQWWLAKWLGVSRVTICKMVRALRELGIIELRVDSNDRHMRRLVLTRFGRKRFARALKAIRRGRIEGTVRFAWRASALSRRETTSEVDQLFLRTRRYCWGHEDYSELYRYS